MGVYQLGFGVPVSVNELIEVIRHVTGRDFAVSYEPARAGEILHTHCDIAKARGAFGYTPKVTLAEGVEQTWAWFEKSGWAGA
jgi:UDP-glucose 4-epimerase